MARKKSKTGSKSLLDREFAAAVLFEAAFSRDQPVADKYGITVRTITNYRARLDRDLVLAGLVAAKRRAFEQATRGLPPALTEALERLDEMAAFARGGGWVSPSSLEAVSERLRSVLGAQPASQAGPAAASSARPRRRVDPRPSHEKW